MSRTTRNALLVQEIFKPDDKGNSEWKTRDEIDLTGLKLCKNGNIRHNIPWTDKYIWEIVLIINHVENLLDLEQQDYQKINQIKDQLIIKLEKNYLMNLKIVDIVCP